MKPNKNKPDELSKLKAEIKELKAENKLLYAQRSKFREMLVDIVKKWRYDDEKTATACYDACRLVGLKIAALDYKMGAAPKKGKDK